MYNVKIFYEKFAVQIKTIMCIGLELLIMNDYNWRIFKMYYNNVTKNIIIKYYLLYNLWKCTYYKISFTCMVYLYGYT